MLSYGISLRNTKSSLYLWELLQNTSFQPCRWLALWVVLHSYLSVSCYDDVIFNFYYFNTVPIEKPCSLILKFSLLFYLISTVILKFPSWFLASLPWFSTFFTFSSRFPVFPCRFSALAFPSHCLHSRTYSPNISYSVLQFPIFAFKNSLLSL